MSKKANCHSEQSEESRFFTAFRMTSIPLLIPALFCSALAGASVLILPKIMERVINHIQSGSPVQGLYALLAIFASAALSAVLFRYISAVSFAWTAQKAGERLRLNAMRNVMNASLGRLEENRPHSMLTALVYDIPSITQFIESGLAKISGTFWLYVLGFVFLATLDFKYIPVIVPALTVSFTAAFFWHRKLEHYYYAEREAYAGYQSSLAGWLDEMEVIKFQAHENDIAGQFDRTSSRHLSAVQKSNVFSGSFLPAVLMVWGLAGAVFVLIGADGYRSGTITCGAVAASFQYLAFFALPTLDLCYAGDLLRKARVSWREMAVLETAGEDIPLLERSDFIQRFKPGRIHMVNAASGWADEIKEICLKGGGLFAGKRNGFFKRSLMNNFALADPAADFHSAARALEMACLSDEKGPEEWLSRDPHYFSSGEKKRAALARVFLMQDERFWILEEPAEGLNPELVSKLLGRLEQFRDKKSIIIISSDVRINQWAEKVNSG